MKKGLGIGLLIILLAGGVWYYMQKQEDDIVQQVEADYMQDGIIRAYDRSDAQRLSESLGQYMQYVLLIDDEERFKEQVQILNNHFLVERGSDVYIKWELGEKTATNAWIDDIRISETLMKAGKQFNEPTYSKLASRIETTLLKRQRIKGKIVDFYDWDLQQATDVLHLNYLEPPALKRLKLLDFAKERVAQAKREGPFTAELYFANQNESKWADDKVVNMIDQVLIERLRVGVTGESDASFRSFISKELKNGKIYARYDRLTATPTMKDESSSVYALLVPLLNGEERSFVLKRLREIETTNAKETHVFDVLNKAVILKEFE